jgi:hypothetical protein
MNGGANLDRGFDVFDEITVGKGCRLEACAPGNGNGRHGRR